MTSFKMTAGADCAFLHVDPSLCCKGSFPLIVSGGSWPLDTSAPLPPNPELLASEIKQTFLSINLASLLAFERKASDPSFSNTSTA